MLLKSKIEHNFKKEFYNLTQIFKKYGYLKTIGSYNKDEIKYITDIDMQFRLSNKYKSNVDNYLHFINDILTKFEKYINNRKTNLIFEAIKTFREVDYAELLTEINGTNAHNNKLIGIKHKDELTRKYYTVTEILNNKEHIKNIFNNEGIIKINMFYNYNNGEYYVPIDLIIIKSYLLNENIYNITNCILCKNSMNNMNYLKSLKKIQICINILNRLNIINLPNELSVDKPKLKSHRNILPEKIIINKQLLKSLSTKTKKHNHSKKYTLTKTHTKTYKRSKQHNILLQLLSKDTTLLNKKLLQQIKEITYDNITKQDAESILIKIITDINNIIISSYYIYSIFSYASNINKIINIPDIVFKKLYNSNNIHKLYNSIKTIISIILKKKELLGLKPTDTYILERIYKTKINTKDYKNKLQSIITKIEIIEQYYQLTFKSKAEQYYAQYLNIVKHIIKL